MSRWILTTAGAILFSGFFLVSPASAGPQIYVNIGPPAHVVEVRPVVRAGYVWQDGYYRWNGHRYVWVGGRSVTSALRARRVVIGTLGARPSRVLLGPGTLGSPMTTSSNTARTETRRTGKLSGPLHILVVFRTSVCFSGRELRVGAFVNADSIHLSIILAQSRRIRSRLPSASRRSRCEECPCLCVPPALLLVCASTSVAFAQLSPTADWATHAQNEYAVAANVTYLTASGYESKLDVYRRRDVQTPQPTLVFYHGGGWIGGTKEASFMSIMPWLEMGWNVVNVEYRMARVAEAPAAVEDAMCALRYVVEQREEQQHRSRTKIVVSGESAGGHLALAVGMIPATAGFTSICAGGGFTGNRNRACRRSRRSSTGTASPTSTTCSPVRTRGRTPCSGSAAGQNRDDVAKTVSPLTYVRAGLPPILSIQGDADPIVPYSQNTRLRDALTKAGTANELFTIPGGGHGNFNAEQRTQAYVKIREFLTKNGLASQ